MVFFYHLGCDKTLRDFVLRDWCILSALGSFGPTNFNLFQLVQGCGVRLITGDWSSFSDEAVALVSWSPFSCYKRSVPTESKLRRMDVVFGYALTVTPTYLYMQSPMTSGSDPDSKISKEVKKRKPNGDLSKHKTFFLNNLHNYILSLNKYVKVTLQEPAYHFYILYISLACVMANSMIISFVLVTVRVAYTKTVSIDCLS